jgi:hypothetical protein
MRYIGILLLLAGFLSGCGPNPLEGENQKLKTDLAQAQTDRDKALVELKKLKQTDNYFYQQAVEARRKGDFSASNKAAKEVLDRYPQSPLRVATGKLLMQNSDDVATKDYRAALSAYEAKSYDVAGTQFARFLAEHPDSRFAGHALELKRSIRSKKAAAEAEAAREAEHQAEIDARAGAKLELVDWHWGQTESESYVEAEGRVKNISDEPIRSVVAVVQFESKSGEMITAGDALIDFNPIMPGQTSPFKVMETYNPMMKSASITFKEHFGGEIQTYRRKGR